MSHHPGKGSVILLAILLVFLLGAVLLLFLPAFRVENIIVEGNVTIDPIGVADASEISKGDHLMARLGGGIIRLFSMRYGGVEDRLTKQFPYIKNIRVEAEIPSTVRISIEERYKIAYLDVPDGFAVIDTEGYILDIRTSSPPQGVPIIYGIPVRTAVLGKPISLSDDRGLNRCLIILGAVLSADSVKAGDNGYDLMSCIVSVRYIGDNTNYLTVKPAGSANQFLVKIGSLTNIREDMAWLRHALSGNKIEYLENGVLDMTGADYTLRENT